MTKQTKRKLPKKGIFGFLLILLIPGALIIYQVIQPDAPKSTGTKESVVEVGGENKSEDKPGEEEPYKYHYKKDVDAAKVNAESFARAYTAFNGARPDENQLNAVPYATPEISLKLQNQGQEVRPTVDMYQRQVTKVSSDYEDGTDMYFKVQVEGTFFNDKGKKFIDTVTLYNILLRHEESGKWLVSDFSVQQDDER
ncbi:hypothetical protein HCJ39_07110 [Listeria rocourtiae]|uniref:hypothetical protein n=1 Tax=Listeria rocourtiae TaxID=647910 RepID=UPI001628F222|nr:hypothetical protein [Listeria rocourtiae]MBC1604479.1 hypothetical protein [Listeria rocourtiae]